MPPMRTRLAMLKQLQESGRLSGEQKLELDRLIAFIDE